jgi:hypothetical protein
MIVSRSAVMSATSGPHAAELVFAEPAGERDAVDERHDHFLVHDVVRHAGQA